MEVDQRLLSAAITKAKMLRNESTALVSMLEQAGMTVTRPRVTVNPPGDNPPSYDTLIKSLYERHDIQRQRYGRPTFRWNNALGKAAQRHSEDQQARGRMGHDGTNGSTAMDTETIG